MYVHYHFEDFVDVPPKQKEFYKKITSKYFKNDVGNFKYQKELRRLFDKLSEIVLKEVQCPDTSQQPFLRIGMFDVVDFPKNLFEEVLLIMSFVCDCIRDTGFGLYSDEEYFKENRFALYSNIRHLMLITVHRLKLRGFYY